MTLTDSGPVQIEDTFGYKAMYWMVTETSAPVIASLFGGRVEANSNSAYRPTGVTLEFPGVLGLKRHVRKGNYVVWREEAGFGVMTETEVDLYYRRNR